MSKVSWGYLIRVFISDDEGTPLENFRFEAMGISPYQQVLGKDLEEMKSDEYKYLSNPMAIAHFISFIGDSNFLSVMKKKDLKSNLLKKSFDDKTPFFGIHLDIASLRHISQNLKGDQRLTKLNTTALESVALKDVSVTNFYSFSHKSGATDLVTFKCKETLFQFE